MKILAVGMNYAKHVDELNNQLSSESKEELVQSLPSREIESAQHNQLSSESKEELVQSLPSREIESAQHNKTLKNTFIPTEPVIFSKQESSLIRDHKPFFVPDFAERFDYETELVIRIAHVGKDISERFAHRYYDEVTVGIDFTARDLQAKLKAKGLPWDICKGFDGSAAVGQFVKIADLGGDIQNINFHLDMNGQTVQQGNSRDMIFTVDKIVAYCSRFFTLKTGDLIFTGTPVGIGPVKEGDLLEGYIGDQKLLNQKIK